MTASASEAEEEMGWKMSPQKEAPLRGFSTAPTTPPGSAEHGGDMRSLERAGDISGHQEPTSLSPLEGEAVAPVVGDAESLDEEGRPEGGEGGEDKGREGVGEDEKGGIVERIGGGRVRTTAGEGGDKGGEEETIGAMTKEGNSTTTTTATKTPTNTITNTTTKTPTTSTTPPPPSAPQRPPKNHNERAVRLDEEGEVPGIPKDFSAFRAVSPRLEYLQEARQSQGQTEPEVVDMFPWEDAQEDEDLSAAGRMFLRWGKMAASARAALGNFGFRFTPPGGMGVA